jgi:DNA-binding SARP family transcriptional activator
MPGTYELDLLGGFSLRRWRKTCRVPNGGRRLVAYVALHGSCRRGEMAGALWPDVSEERALATLRTGIWRLNRALPGLITCTESMVELTPPVSVDCREQEALARRVLSARDLDGAWLQERMYRLWPGDLLPGWYDDWVVHEREGLRQLRLCSLERAASIFLEEGTLHLAMAAALEAVWSEPLRESANAVLISVHLAEGNVVEAVRCYEHYRRHLVEELGVDPSPALTGLLPRHLRAAVPGPRVVGGVRPDPATPSRRDVPEGTGVQRPRRPLAASS